MSKTYNQTRYAEYDEDDVAVTLRRGFGDYGGAARY